MLLKQKPRRAVSGGGFEPAEAGGALSEKISFGFAAYCVLFRNQGSVWFVLVQNLTGH